MRSPLLKSRARPERLRVYILFLHHCEIRNFRFLVYWAWLFEQTSPAHIVALILPTRYAAKYVGCPRPIIGQQESYGVHTSYRHLMLRLQVERLALLTSFLHLIRVSYLLHAHVMSRTMIARTGLDCTQ